MNLRTRRKREVAVGVDMTPLIDMVFILLIFFMVSTTFVKDLVLDIERPAASSARPASLKEVRVLLDRHGGLFLDDQPVKPWMLQSRVRERLQAGASGAVLVVTDRLVPAERLVEAVDQCRLAGAREVGVATEREAG
jgi:biopolymer transport protein ExbD